MNEKGSRLLLQPLRYTLRLAAARAEPSAYAPGRRVQMHSRDNTRVWRGYILEPFQGITPPDMRRVHWDDDDEWVNAVSTVPVVRLELVSED